MMADRTKRNVGDVKTLKKPDPKGSVKFQPIPALNNAVVATEQALRREAAEAEVERLRKVIVEAASNADMLMAGTIQLRDMLKKEEASEAATRKAHGMSVWSRGLSNLLYAAIAEDS